ncbi:transcription termination factor MTEF18, mitochondrial-like [Argentina anserina]|uniref:transcription termination factor MTEF18, mitochondrial-like n=1 Tax=Argentina anserina TaxID=57926 RepID=UPI0021767A24|nr:transcription termination factor MTEF18, mitochondrial-like [Potentilla anserina]
MTHLPKLRIASIPNWVSSILHENHLRLPRTLFQPFGDFPNDQIPRLYSTNMAPETENQEVSVKTPTSRGRKATRTQHYIKVEIQAALLEYLHSTRGLQFTDAENISKNCPHFLNKLYKRVDCERGIRRSMARFLQYHPINEFEPFFESLGFEPSECISLLPRNLMYLTDDELLLHNYIVLSNYGIPPNKIGKIYREAREVFRFDYQVLASKLQAYEGLGLGRSALVRYVVGSPYLLVGDVNAAFLSVLAKSKSIGFETDSIEGNLWEDNTYHWSRVLELFSLFSEIGCSDVQLGKLLGHNPDILFENSGATTVSLIGLLHKFGFTKRELHSMFLQFPQIPVAKFVANLRRCILFLDEIDMEAAEIAKIVHSHPLLLGSCSLKKTSSLLGTLNVGKKRLSQYIQENPEELKNWVLGKKLESFPDSEYEVRSRAQKTKFLLEIGFLENSTKMKAALKACRGNGVELQERFDCIVKAGLDQKDVCELIQSTPQILNQTTDVIAMKIDCLVNELGYPISSLLTARSYLSHKMERVKLRVRMFNWLKDQGMANAGLSLSTLISCSESYFIKTYVHRHPDGPQIWDDLKNEIESSC